MGLTVHYDWKVAADVAAARRFVEQFHAIAEELPFDKVSEIYEQDPPEGASRYCLYDGTWRYGGLYLSRQREDGERELVDVPAIHSMFFLADVAGAETATIGLASHPPVVVHREDVIERDEDGRDVGRIMGQGAPIEFPTERRGYYSWSGFCKTQYASDPKLGGEANFLRSHLSLIELLDRIRELGMDVTITDESEYAAHRDVNRLLATLRDWNAIVARVVGKLSDVLGNEAGAVRAPIKERPDFEHLEAKGIDVLRRMAEEQRRRGEGS